MLNLGFIWNVFNALTSTKDRNDNDTVLRKSELACQPEDLKEVKNCTTSILFEDQEYHTAH